MGLVDDLHCSVGMTEEKRVLGDGFGAVRVGIGRPLEEPDRSSVVTVRATGAVIRLERLASGIGYDHCCPTRREMDERGRQRTAKVFFGRHVVDGVVDEHRIERTIETQRSHVGAEVFGARYEAPRHVEHGLGQVNKRQVEVGRKVRGVASAPAAEFQQRPTGPLWSAEQTQKEQCFLAVVLDGRYQRPPRGK